MPSNIYILQDNYRTIGVFSTLKAAEDHAANLATYYLRCGGDDWMRSQMIATLHHAPVNYPFSIYEYTVDTLPVDGMPTYELPTIRVYLTDDVYGRTCSQQVIITQTESDHADQH